MTEEVKTETNTFAKMDQENKAVKPTEPQSTSGEISIDDCQEKSISEKVKYVRPDLDGTQDIVKNCQVFMPDINIDKCETTQKNNEYWKVSVILTYNSVNEDQVQNREYISGCRVYKQRDGSSSDRVYWYEGSETQTAYLWELVAKKKGVLPEDLSEKVFLSYLKSEPGVNLVKKEYKNWNAPAGAPATVYKNLPGEFLSVGGQK